MAFVPLSNSDLQIIVDDSDYGAVSKAKWTLLKRTGYVIRCLSYSPTTYLHVFLLGAAPDGLEWDHINRNKLDNRRGNFRLATHSQNNANVGLTKSNRSGFKGVGWFVPSSRWRARIRVNDKLIALGYYKTPEQAAHAYDAAAKVYFGEFAWLNYPGER